MAQRENLDFVTVDVFDTLLLRDSTSLAGTAAKVHRRLSSTSKLHGNVTQGIFVKARLTCQNLAYWTLPRASNATVEADPNLADIYRMVGCYLGINRGSRLEELVFWGTSAELEIECSQLSICRHTEQMIMNLIDTGTSVGLFSDMYLSPSDIRYLLDRSGSRLARLPIWTSSSLPVAKRDGTLFRAAKEHRIKLLHVGDSSRGELRPAMLEGVAVIRVLPPPVPTLLRRCSTFIESRRIHKIGFRV